MAISNTTEEQIRKAQRALGVNVPLTPDEQLAVANAAKGTSGGYTNTPTTSTPIAGLDRVVTPTPIQETITPVQPVVSNPYADFIKTLQKPITPEEEARRERAARAVQGVAGLGNLMSAFANLTFTGKGAPSQTLPTQSVDAMTDRTTSWKDKLKAEREKYQAAELGAKVEQWKAELDAQHRAQQQANVDRAHEENVRQFNERMAKEEQARQDKLKESEQKQSNWEREQKAKEEYNKGMLDIYGRRADIQQQNADTRTANANAKTIQKSLSEGKNQIPLRYGDIGGKSPMDVVLDANKLNEASYQQIVNLLDAETKKHYRIDENTKGADLKTKVHRVIGDELHVGNEEILKYLTQTGALTLKTSWNNPVDNQGNQGGFKFPVQVGNNLVDLSQGF